MSERSRRGVTLRSNHVSIAASAAYFREHEPSTGTRTREDNEVREDGVCSECGRTMSKLNLCVCGKCIVRCCTCPTCGYR